MSVYGDRMKTLLGISILALSLGPLAAAQDSSIAPAQQAPTQRTSPQESGAHKSATNSSNSGNTEAVEADAYYYFALGHIDEEQYEATGRSDYATQAIDSYKKALSLDPNSPVIIERLAEIYAKSQHIRNAVAEAEEALKADPNNLNAHRLLARIYVRTLGDLNAGQVQKESLLKAVEQFEAILKLEPNDDNSALWLARLYRFQNDHEKAEGVLRGILKREPDNESALEQLSQLLLDAGKAQDAIDLLSGAASGSDSPGLYDLLGNAYAQDQIRDYPKAETAYRKAVELDPDDPGHRRGLAQALAAQDKYADALEQYKRLTELEPESSENYLRMAAIYRRINKLDQAESSLLRAKQLAPGSLEVLFNESLLYETEGRFDDAAQVLSDAIAGIRSQPRSETSPSNALSILYERLGLVYREQENYDAALKTFDDMAQLGPDAAKRAQILRIDTYRESHNIDRAIAEAQKALAASPKDQNLIVTYAMLLGEKAQTDEAEKALRGLLQGNHNDQEIYLDLAQVQERGRRYAAAEQSAAKAEELSRRPEEKETVWYMLGAIYERQKKYDDAEQQFRNVLSQNPNNAAALNYYGYMLADRGVRLEEATKLIQRAVNQEPVNGAYLDSLGWAYYKQNKLAEAEEYLSKAAGRQSHDPTILSHLGEVYYKLGQTQRAAEIYERALAEWQKALPADYEPERVANLEQQLKTLKRRLAQKSGPVDTKP
jgi:tetratricopeptide (TPR) repeat protein